MRKVFKVGGVACGHCAARLQSELMTIHGINNAYVDKEKQTATIQLSFDVKDDVIKEAILEQGFEYKEKIKES